MVLFIQVVERKFPEDRFEHYTSFAIEFDYSDTIKVDIPEEGVTLDKGLKMIPIHMPMVS